MVPGVEPELNLRPKESAGNRPKGCYKWFVYGLGCVCVDVCVEVPSMDLGMDKRAPMDSAMAGGAHNDSQN